MHDIYSSESMDILEALADKHGLMLSTELINFADDVWAIATQAERQANALAKELEGHPDEDVRVYFEALPNIRKGITMLEGEQDND